MTRGYPSQNLILELNPENNYLMRVKRNSASQWMQLRWGSSITSIRTVVPICPCWDKTLPSGEIETLNYQSFQSGNGGISCIVLQKKVTRIVKYDIVKNKLELPNFCGFTENILMQDFWISMYLANWQPLPKRELT